MRLRLRLRYRTPRQCYLPRTDGRCVPAAGRLDQRQLTVAHRRGQTRPADEGDIMPRQRQPRPDERSDGPCTDDQYAQCSLESRNDVEGTAWRVVRWANR